MSLGSSDSSASLILIPCEGNDGRCGLVSHVLIATFEFVVVGYHTSTNP
jgi:hypothetical protein